jgi:hypothetical protein
LEERQKQNGVLRSDPNHKSGSCFQPFVKRPRRRPGKPIPLPLHILEPIKEENTDEDTPEEVQEEEIKNATVDYVEITIEPEISELPESTEVSLA